MDKIVIEILKDYSIIGNALFHHDGFLPNTISKVTEIIDNYNMNLSRGLLFNEELAIRMFEIEDASGSSKTRKPILAINSIKFMKKQFPTVYLSKDSNTNYAAGVIAITDKDKQINLNESTKIARINLDKKTISFMGTHLSILKTKWSEYSDIDASKFNVCEYDFSNLPFNELEDAWYFIRSNKEGWLDKEYDKARYVFKPIFG